MKKSIIILISVLITFLSCKKENGYNASDDPGHVRAKLKSAQIVSASNKFAFDFYKSFEQLAGNQNFFISPFSVVEALSMTYNGANGDTKNEMANTLGFAKYSDNQINEYNQSLANALVSADDKVQFEIANSIWYRQLLGFNVLPSFIDVNKNYYNAEVNSLDFNSPVALSTINNWVDSKTHGKIPTILDNIPSDAMMYLINAIYFKGTWQYQFDKTKTNDTDFHAEDGSVVKHVQMQLETHLNYYSGNGYTAVELPYGNSAFNLIMAMPDTGKIADFILNMNDSKWANMIESLSLKEVVVKMPKFKFELNCLLNNSLENIGMKQAFNPDSADFSRIDGNRDLYISRVIHKTYIGLNEEGTEAAAVTAVEIRNATSPGPGVKEEPVYLFEANRPFIYAIVEKSTGVILFLGKMVDPTVTSVEVQ